MAPRFGRHAYTLDAVLEAGVPADVARTLLADTTIAERPLRRLGGRSREPEATTRYVWGPDANTLLAEREVMP